MKRKFLLIITLASILILPGGNASARDKWTRVQSRNFTLVGNAGEGDMRKIATKLEEFRNGSRQLMGVLEGKMTPEEVSRARTEASRWRPVSNTPPAPPPAAADTSRTYQAPPAPTASAAPPVTSNSQPPAKTSANSDDLGGSIGKTIRKNDIDGILDQVPQGLRKKFGF